MKTTTKQQQLGYIYIERERRIELTIHSPVAGTTSGGRSRRRRCMAEAGVQQRREQQVRQQSEPRRQRAHGEQYIYLSSDLDRT